MAAKKTKRAGSTKTVGISMDAATEKLLRKLAKKRHGGNVSALIREWAEEAKRTEAFERAWKWYGGPEPTPEQMAEIDREAREGWALARKYAAKGRRSKRKRAA